MLVEIYNEVLTFAAHRQYQQLNQAMEELDLDSLNRKQLLAYLMASHPTRRDLIPSRNRVYEAARKRFTEELGERRAAAILDRYK